MTDVLALLAPWELSPPTVAACGGAIALYLRGWARGARPALWRSAAFLGGVALMYVVMQTRFDYYAQYLFFAHRGQHLILHHLAPFLIALAAPGAVLAAGLPGRLRSTLSAPARPLRAVYRGLQNPWVAGTLFVGLIAFWLIPAIHFDAMLSRRLY
jgi:putative membrane protein